MWWFLAKTLLKLYIADSVIDKTIIIAFGGNRQNAIDWLDDRLKDLNKIYQNKLLSN
jgi:hypothetical protein